MNTETENRRHPRIPLWWPVVLMPSSGPIMGTIKNISVSGALISCSEPIENENEFLIILKAPKGREMPISCKKVWSDNMSVGFIFTKISSSIKNFISSLVEDSISYGVYESVSYH